MRRLLALALVVAGLTSVSPVDAHRPGWLTSCAASTYNGSFSAYCARGNTRYLAYATCYKPKVGSYREYGSYVWPGIRSKGVCNLGYLASNPGWMQ